LKHANLTYYILRKIDEDNLQALHKCGINSKTINFRYWEQESVYSRTEIYSMSRQETVINFTRRLSQIGPAKRFRIGTVSFVSSKISMKQTIQRMCFAYVYDCNVSHRCFRL
jgi:hypothetical protein